MLTSLTNMVDKAVLSAVGRDSIVDLLLKNIPENLSPGLGWASQFMEKDGIAKLLSAAVVQPTDRQKVGSSLNVTNETRIHVSLALQKIYDDLDSDKKRKIFTDKCEEFVQRLLADPDPETKMLAVLVVITLLQGTLFSFSIFLIKK
jgi:Myosin-binding striated muscle assembly central